MEWNCKAKESVSSMGSQKVTSGVRTSIHPFVSSLYPSWCIARFNEPLLTWAHMRSPSRRRSLTRGTDWGDRMSTWEQNKNKKTVVSKVYGINATWRKCKYGTICWYLCALEPFPSDIYGRNMKRLKMCCTFGLSSEGSSRTRWPLTATAGVERKRDP